MDTDQALNSAPQGTSTTRAKLLLAALTAAGCLIAALLAPAAAPAAKGKGSTPKQGLTTGFQDGFVYQTPDAATRARWFDRTTAAGGGIVRLVVIWPSIVGNSRPADASNPGNTAYDFSMIDPAVRDAQARGLKVMLSVNGAPPWAEGPGRPASGIQEHTWKPNLSDLRNFFTAVATRYSGNFDPDGSGPQPTLPAAYSVQAWNEPNSSDWITPQFEGRTAVSPDYYRDMLNTAYDAVKAVAPRMLVVAGGTEPYGDPPGGPYPPGTQRVEPVLFWQQLLCVRPLKTKKKKGKKGKTPQQQYVRTCNQTAKFDIAAHHPIDNTGGGPLKHGPRPGDASTPDLGRITNVVRGAEKVGTISPGGRHPIWATEFWWDSNPPNPVGSSPMTQARYIEQSMYLFWKAGAEVAINFQIQDVDVRPDVHAGYQAGVYFKDGSAKPSLTAFSFPFVTSRINKNMLEAWGKSPAAGKLLIQAQKGSTFRTVKKLQVSKGGVFVTKLKLKGKQRLRATVGSEKSLVWKQAAAAKRVSSSSGSGPSIPRLILLIGGGILALGFLGRQHVLRRRRGRRYRSSPRPVTG